MISKPEDGNSGATWDNKNKTTITIRVETARIGDVEVRELLMTSC